jgi:hypothetical protein
MASTNQGNQGNQSGNKDSSVNKAQDVSSDMPGSSNRASATIPPNTQREVPSKGGKPAHESGSGQELSAEELREAARKANQSGSSEKR